MRTRRAPAGRTDEVREPVEILDAGETREGLDAGGGCQAATALVVVPLALEVVALLLIWPGPGAGDRWFVKGLLVAVGGLLATVGYYLAQVALAARSMARFDAPGGLDLYAPIATVLAGGGERIVALRGRAEPDPAAKTPDGGLLRAPLSRQRCLVWSLSVHRLVGQSGDAGHHTIALHEETRSPTFWLRDGTGRIRVDPTGALVSGVVADEREVYRADGESALRALERDVQAAGLAIELPLTPATVGYVAQEEILEPGTEVTVIGPTLVRDGERIVAAGGPDDPFSISPFDELGIAATFRKTARRLRVAAVVVPVLGIVMILVGFWWILAG